MIEIEESGHGLQEQTDTTWQFAITGASGLLGSHLTRYLELRGHAVAPLVRDRERVGEEEIYWNVVDQEIDAEGLEGVDAVIHLAGENLFGRWTESKKRAIRESRLKGTTLISETLAALDSPPEVFVSVSGVGFYGHTGDEWVDEEGPRGEGFLAELCEEWEASTDPAREAGIRTVLPRNGVVITSEGGALEMMLTPFKLGLGGRVGSGEQYLSWTGVDDWVRTVEFLTRYSELEGPVNVCTPNPVTNEEFAETLGDVLNRPTFLPVPAFGARLVFGQLADEALLGGQRVQPAKLQEAGFEWEFPEIEAVFRAELE